jgi:hypothetical protein
MHENREASEVPEANLRDRPAGEGKSHTARAHIFEESDSGTVPMNHSNKSGKPPAENEEGRTLDQGEHSSIQHALDTERGSRFPGVGAEEYETGLEGRLVDLFSRVHRGAVILNP